MSGRLLPFRYFMHDDYDSSERADWIERETGVPYEPDEVGRPFYEIQLDCELDPETGRIFAVGLGGVRLERPLELG